MPITRFRFRLKPNPSLGENEEDITTEAPNQDEDDETNEEIETETETEEVDFTEVTFNCTVGVCKMGVKAESRINLCIHFTTGLIGECGEGTDTEVCTPGLLLECHPKPNLATALVDAFLPSFDSQEPLIIYPITDFNNLKSRNGKSRVLTFSSSRRMSRRNNFFANRFFPTVSSPRRILELFNQATNSKSSLKHLIMPRKRIPTSLKLVPFASFGGLMYFSMCMEDLNCQKAWDRLGEDLKALVYNTYSKLKSFAEDTIFFIGQSIEDVQNYFTESNGK